MAKKKQQIVPRRGELYLVNFDPTIGSEIKKTRPALILQNDIANRYSPVTIVAAFTSQLNESVYPTEVFIEPPEGGLERRSVVLLNQVRAIDKQRLVTKLGALKSESMVKVDNALQISLGLVNV